MTIAPETGLELTSTVLRSAVAEAWQRANWSHDRNWQTDPGVSSVFGCQRQVAYQFAGTEPSDNPAPPGSRIDRQATLGTWIHQEFLPLLAASLGAEVIEAEVFAEFVRGHLDLAGTRYVIDLKTCGIAKLSRVRNDGPSRANLAQVMLYAKARRDAGYPVDRVGLVFIDRESGEDYCWTGPYDPGLVDEALVWFHEAKHAVPDQLPRTRRGPGLDYLCDDCVFRSRCWPEAQKTVLNEAEDRDVAMESVLAMYHQASTAESAAKETKAFAAAILEGEPKGDYGPWRLGRGSTGRRLNQKAATEILEDLGIPVPKNEPTYYPKVTRRKGVDEDG